MAKLLMLKLFFIFFFISRCATKSDIVDEVSIINSEFNRKFSIFQMENIQSISLIEEKIDSLKSRISSIETLKENFTVVNQDSYLKVISPISIYSEPRATDQNIIAKADEGAYLRKLSCKSRCIWFKVEFLIDDYPYIGYVMNNTTGGVEEKRYDPDTFTRLYKRGLVKYYWEKELEVEIKNRKYKKTIGIFIKSDQHNKYDSGRFIGHFARTFRNYGIYLIPINAYRGSSDNYDKPLEQYDIRQKFGENNVDVILIIDIVSSNFKSIKKIVLLEKIE